MFSFSHGKTKTVCSEPQCAHFSFPVAGSKKRLFPHDGHFRDRDDAASCVKPAFSPGIKDPARPKGSKAPLSCVFFPSILSPVSYPYLIQEKKYTNVQMSAMIAAPASTASDTLKGETGALPLVLPFLPLT